MTLPCRSKQHLPQGRQRAAIHSKVQTKEGGLVLKYNSESNPSLLGQRFGIVMIAVAIVLAIFCGPSQPVKTSPQRETSTVNAELLRVLEEVERDCGCAEGRTTPIGVYVSCMDCRVHIDKVLGRFGEGEKFNRTHMAGCVLSDEVIESLRLTVLKHDVRIILILDHTDCAVRTLEKQPLDWRFERLQTGRKQFNDRLDQIAKDKVLGDFFRAGRLKMIHAEVDIKQHHAVRIIRKFGFR